MISCTCCFVCLQVNVNDINNILQFGFGLDCWSCSGTFILMDRATKHHQLKKAWVQEFMHGLLKGSGTHLIRPKLICLPNNPTILCAHSLFQSGLLQFLKLPFTSHDQGPYLSRDLVLESFTKLQAQHIEMPFNLFEWCV